MAIALAALLALGVGEPSSATRHGLVLSVGARQGAGRSSGPIARRQACHPQAGRRPAPCGSRSDRDTGSPELVGRVALEPSTVTLGIEQVLAVAQQLGDPLDVVEQRELPGGVVPLVRVIVVRPRRGCGERLDLELVLLPPGADRHPIALTQHHHVAPQLFEPQSPLTRVEAVRVQRPAGVGQLIGIVAVVVGGCAWRTSVGGRCASRSRCFPGRLVPGPYSSRLDRLTARSSERVPARTGPSGRQGAEFGLPCTFRG